MMKMPRWIAALIGFLFTWFAAAASAAGQDVLPGHDNVKITSADLPALSPAPLKVRHVRLKRTTSSDLTDTVVTFDIINEGEASVSNVVFQVLLLEIRAGARPRIMLGPFTVRSKSSLDAENTMALEMLIPDVPPGCACWPLVRIVSASAP